MMPIAGDGARTHLVHSMHVIDAVCDYAFDVMTVCADGFVASVIEHVVGLAEFMTCDNPCPECVEDYKKRCRLGERTPL